MRTKSTKLGWTKTGRGEYHHENGHRVVKRGWVWEVIGPNQNDGHYYGTLWAAMDAAAKTPAVFVR